MFSALAHQFRSYIPLGVSARFKPYKGSGVVQLPMRAMLGSVKLPCSCWSLLLSLLGHWLADRNMLFHDVFRMRSFSSFIS